MTQMATQFIAAGLTIPENEVSAMIRDLQYLLSQGFSIDGIGFVDAVAQNINRARKGQPLLDILVYEDEYAPHKSMTYHVKTRGDGAYDRTRMDDGWLSPISSERQLAEWRAQTSQDDFLRRTKAWMKKVYGAEVSLEEIAGMVEKTQAAFMQRALQEPAELDAPSSPSRPQSMIERGYYKAQRGVEEWYINHGTIVGAAGAVRHGLRINL